MGVAHGQFFEGVDVFGRVEQIAGHGSIEIESIANRSAHECLRKTWIGVEVDPRFVKRTQQLLHSMRAYR